MGDERWYTVEEVAERWNLSAEAVRRMVRRGELTVMDLGGRRGYRIRQREVERFEQERMKERRDDDLPTIT